MIKVIVFDWGGVLIDNPSSGLKEYCANSLGVSLQQYTDVMTQYKKDFQLGNILESDLWQKVSADLGGDVPQTESLWLDAVRTVFHEKMGMFDLIDKLKSESYKIGFLSNTEIPAVEYWKEKNYEKYFDEAIFSCVEHVAKPDVRIYEIMCERLNVESREVIFIDDKIEFIESAKSIGMGGIMFETIEQTKSDLDKIINL